MQIIRHLVEFPSQKKALALTIGNFDGMHLGHCAVLKALKACAQENHLEAAVLTFENHPSTVLHPHHPIQLVSALPHKIALIEQMQIDWLILLPFTKEFAQQTAEVFLETLKKHVNFTHLILGDDAVLGKDRKGDPASIQALSKRLDFTVTYLPPHCEHDKKVSSSQIRKLVLEGHLNEVEQLLGRKYSIMGLVQSGQGKGHKLGFPTANFAVQGLCVPPFGVYVVTLKIDHKTYKGVANLGLAPTLRKEEHPILEVHLFDAPLENFVGTQCEVIFHAFLRPEQKFASIDLLTTQVKKDIQQAKQFSID